MSEKDEQIARVIQNARRMHEKSYVKAEGEDKRGWEAKRGWENCWQVACKEEKLFGQIWYVLYLANHWPNDLQDWADSVLAGKDDYKLLFASESEEQRKVVSDV